MPVCTEFVSLFALTLAATACSAPPDKIALYPGFTYEQMSRFEPGTGEYLEKNGTLNLDPVVVDIIDPTTDRAFVSLADRSATLTSDGRILSLANIHSPDGRDWLVSRDSLVDTVRTFIDHGWQCRDRDNPQGPVLEAAAIALPEGFCVVTREHGRGWTCAAPPGWPSASTFFVWGCGAETNEFSFAWSLQMVD